MRHAAGVSRWRGRMRRRSAISGLVATVVLAVAAVDLRAEPGLSPEVSAAWERLNDPATAPRARDEAEAVLLESNSALLIPIVFDSIATPAGGYPMEEAVSALPMDGRTSVEIDQRLTNRDFSPAAQIACARHRLWRKLVSASDLPRNEVDQQVAKCIKSRTTSLQDVWMFNWVRQLDGLELTQQAMFEFFCDPAIRSESRRLACHRLLQSREARMRYFDLIVQWLWSNRQEPDSVMPNLTLLLSRTDELAPVPKMLDPRALLLVAEELQRQVEGGRGIDQRLAKALMESTDTPPDAGERRAPVPEVSMESQEAMKSAFLDWAARNSARLEAEAAAKAVEALEQQGAEAPEGER